MTVLAQTGALLRIQWPFIHRLLRVPGRESSAGLFARIRSLWSLGLVCALVWSLALGGTTLGRHFGSARTDTSALLSLGLWAFLLLVTAICVLTEQSRVHGGRPLIELPIFPLATLISNIVGNSYMLVFGVAFVLSEIAARDPLATVEVTLSVGIIYLTSISLATLLWRLLGGAPRGDQRDSTVGMVLSTLAGVLLVAGPLFRARWARLEWMDPMAPLARSLLEYAGFRAWIVPMFVQAVGFSIVLNAALKPTLFVPGGRVPRFEWPRRRSLLPSDWAVVLRGMPSRHALIYGGIVLGIGAYGRWRLNSEGLPPGIYSAMNRLLAIVAAFSGAVLVFLAAVRAGRREGSAWPMLAGLPLSPRRLLLRDGVAGAALGLTPCLFALIVAWGTPIDATDLKGRALDAVLLLPLSVILVFISYLEWGPGPHRKDPEREGFSVLVLLPFAVIVELLWAQPLDRVIIGLILAGTIWACWRALGPTVQAESSGPHLWRALLLLAFVLAFRAYGKANTVPTEGPYLWIAGLSVLLITLSLLLPATEHANALDLIASGESITNRKGWLRAILIGLLSAGVALGTAIVARAPVTEVALPIARSELLMPSRSAGVATVLGFSIGFGLFLSGVLGPALAETFHDRYRVRIAVAVLAALFFPPLAWPSLLVLVLIPASWSQGRAAILVVVLMLVRSLPLALAG